MMVKVDGLKWTAEHLSDVQRVCVRACCGRWDLVDELFGCCLDKVQNCCDSYRGDLYPDMPLEKHVLWALSLYCWKWMVKNAKHVERWQTNGESHHGLVAVVFDHVYEHETKDTVYYVMERLTDDERKLLVMHDVYEMTMREMSDALGIALGTVHGRYSKALAHAREVLP